MSPSDDFRSAGVPFAVTVGTVLPPTIAVSAAELVVAIAACERCPPLRNGMHLVNTSPYLGQGLLRLTW